MGTRIGFLLGDKGGDRLGALMRDQRLVVTGLA
jgi:hypothetical protein